MLLLPNDSDKLKEIITRSPKQALFHRLELRGMKKEIIPSYIRSMRICLITHPTMNPLQVDQELQFLGWNDFELDSHTLQLAVTYFETEGITA